MRILRARGIESEAEIPFAGLAEPLRPTLSALDRIPVPQATALAGAVALRPAHPQDRLAIGAATSACGPPAPRTLPSPCSLTMHTRGIARGKRVRRTIASMARDFRGRTIGMATSG